MAGLFHRDHEQRALLAVLVVDLVDARHTYRHVRLARAVLLQVLLHLLHAVLLHRELQRAARQDRPAQAAWLSVQAKGERREGE